MTIDYEQLALDLDGRLVRPGDPRWDTARQAWNLAVDQRPAAVVEVASVRDVQTTVLAAAAAGLRIAPQSTGHNAGPLGDLTDTILLRLGGLRAVSVDGEARIARVEAGAVWQDVTDEVTKHGLAALAGSAGDVGVAGYTLGGGVSWLARTHGFSAQNVVALEVVTADGRLRHVDHEHEPELFWALRGGGGSFAVVTALELRVFPITEVQAGSIFFPMERAAEVLHTWRGLVNVLPEQVLSVGRLLRIPPDPALPPMLAGRPFALVEVASTLSAEETDALVAPLRALGPVLDTIHPTPVAELSQLHMDPPMPVPGVGDGFLLRDFPPAAIDAVLAVAGGAESPLLSIDVRHIAGTAEAGRGGVPAVADGLSGDFVGFAVGIAPDAAAAAVVGSAVEEVLDAVAPWRPANRFLNFTESQHAADRLFDEDTLARLRAVKQGYDPADLIRANHPV